MWAERGGRGGTSGYTEKRGGGKWSGFWVGTRGLVFGETGRGGGEGASEQRGGGGEDEQDGEAAAAAAADMKEEKNLQESMYLM